MTEPAATAGRRLRIVEIAVLADDQEFAEFVDRVSAGGAGTALPQSVAWYDGADLPRVVQADLLEGISAGVPRPAARSVPVPAGEPDWPVHPGDFW